MTENLKIKRFDFEGTLALMRRDYDSVAQCDAAPDAIEVYRGVLYFGVLNLYGLEQIVEETSDAALEQWLEAGKGQHKKANIETLAIFRTNLLPESDYEAIVEKLKDCYLELSQLDEEDEVRELKKKLVLTLISLNFTLYFDGGEEVYSEAQAWLMDREFGGL